MLSDKKNRVNGIVVLFDDKIGIFTTYSTIKITLSELLSLISELSILMFQSWGKLFLTKLSVVFF